MYTERKSNFELLRILCMWGVLTNHVIQNLYDVHTSNFSLANETRVLLMNMSIVAVNCFILISGYFKINPSWKGILRLYAQIAFYVVLLTVIGMPWGAVDLKISLLHMFFPLSHSGMWFMTAYFALFLLAPILNAAFEKANRIEQRLWMLALILVDVYIGYMHQAPEITQNGYHIVHFITLYFIGRYISTTKLINVKWGGVFLVYRLVDDRIARN